MNNELNTLHNFDLTSFKKATNNMIATSENAYNKWEGRARVAKTREYSLEEIKRTIDSGSLADQQKLSYNYFCRDGFYKRILIYYATLLKYIGLLIPNPISGLKLSDKNIQKRYNGALNYIERMELKTMLPNFALKALINGTYYGIVAVCDKEHFSVIDLPYSYCRTRFKDLSGNDIVEFDLSYFSTITDNESREAALAAYPKLVSKAYRKYRANQKDNNQWLMITPEDGGICFQLFDGRPLFLKVIPAAINYDDAVETERDRDLEEIRKIIVQKIPHLADGGLLFEPDEAQVIHEGTVKMMSSNKNVSVLTTYADVDAIVSKTSSDAVSNTLEKMVSHIYDSSGTSKELFSSSGSATLGSSIKNDMSLMMVLANKFAGFVEYIVNKLYGNTALIFSYQILPVTYYNDAEYAETAFKLASSGYSLLLPALALDISQRDFGNLKDLENTVLHLTDKLIPPQTSYTQSGGDGAGRPALDDADKNPRTLENEKSANKNGSL